MMIFETFEFYFWWYNLPRDPLKCDIYSSFTRDTVKNFGRSFFLEYDN